MKILLAKQIRVADRYTIEHEPVASIDLMERAATACFKWIVQHFDTNYSFKVFCGLGNNGGDGLAIARMLHIAGYHVAVFIIHYSKKTSDDFNVNERRLKSLKNVNFTNVHSLNDALPSSEQDIIIDALFGTGLSKNVTGLSAEVISLMNKNEAKIISIDIPSGLFADESSMVSANQIIKARYTLSFQVHKLAFFFAENAEYVGEVVILPIGLNEKFFSTCKSNYELLEKKSVQQIIKKRKSFSHKGNYGHAAIIAGSFGKMGAASLAAKACLKTGAGLVTTYVPACGYEILQTSLPEAMVICDENEKIISSLFNTDVYNTIGVGPGIGTVKETAKALKQIIQNFRKPIVFDADAINIIAANKTLLKLIPPKSVFTPHPKEFERLTGTSKNDFERNKLQIEFSKKYNAFVILKGRYTCISSPNGMCYFNSTGNPGMAKGGSGDTLTGMITGLLAQGYSSDEACIAGVYLHGLAADIAVEKTGEYSLLATDIIDNIGNAFLKLTMDD